MYSLRKLAELWILSSINLLLLNLLFMFKKASTVHTFLIYILKVRAVSSL